MELKEFISETLSQIVEGVVDAQQKTEGKGCVINPADAETSDTQIHTHYKGYIGLVDFEVGLTGSEGKEGKVAVGVFFGDVGIGANKKTDTKNVSVTKIRFSIPIVLPQSGEKHKSKGAKATLSKLP